MKFDRYRTIACGIAVFPVGGLLFYAVQRSRCATSPTDTQHLAPQRVVIREGKLFAGALFEGGGALLIQIGWRPGTILERVAVTVTQEFGSALCGWRTATF